MFILGCHDVWRKRADLINCSKLLRAHNISMATKFLADQMKETKIY